MYLFFSSQWVKMLHFSRGSEQKRKRENLFHLLINHVLNCAFLGSFCELTLINQLIRMTNNWIMRRCSEVVTTFDEKTFCVLHVVNPACCQKHWCRSWLITLKSTFTTLSCECELLFSDFPPKLLTFHYWRTVISSSEIKFMFLNNSEYDFKTLWLCEFAVSELCSPKLECSGLSQSWRWSR